MKNILIINGPNLNLLGQREPGIYGTQTLDNIVDALRSRFDGACRISHFQSNSEGDIIDALHAAGYGEQPVDGIVLNAGAYTHTSLAIADAIAAIPVPVVEVHISNVHARESVRHHSFIAPVCRGTIAGFGPMSYALGVQALLEPHI